MRAAITQGIRQGGESPAVASAHINKLERELGPDVAAPTSSAAFVGIQPKRSPERRGHQVNIAIPTQRASHLNSGTPSVNSELPVPDRAGRVMRMPTLHVEVDDRSEVTPYGGLALASAVLRRSDVANIIDRHVHGIRCMTSVVVGMSRAPHGFGHERQNDDMGGPSGILARNWADIKGPQPRK